MLYFDTSFLVPLILEEPTSARVEQFLRRQSEQLSTSHWTRVEFSSLLAREVRMGGLDRELAIQADMQFEEVVAESFVILSPGAGDFETSKRFLRDHETGLRAGDALHLAIASNRRAASIYTLDKGMLDAGRRLRLPVKAGIRLA